MKKDKKVVEKVKPGFAGWNQSVVSTFLLILLMLVYMTITLIGSGRMAEQADIISSHPFEVVIMAGDMKLYVSEMRTRVERLLMHNSDDDARVVENAMDSLYESSNDTLTLIRKIYLGNQEDVENLGETLTELKKRQSEYLLFAASGKAGQSEMEQYVKESLYPVYDQALEQINRIMDSAQEKRLGYVSSVEVLRKWMLAASVILMTCMIGGLILSQRVLWRQRKELVYRGELFDNLSESIDDTFIISDADTGKIRYCGLNMERVLGIREIGDGDIGGLQQEDVRQIREAVLQHDFDIPYEKVVEYTRPEGEKRFLLIRIYRTYNKKGTQFIVVFSDRTEEIKSHQVLQDAMVNAEKANTAKSEFLSRMSHEIRTPLNAIIGMTTIAAASVEDPHKVEDCLIKINYSSKHLLLLINDVLDMSKIESNKMLLQQEVFDIYQVVNGYVNAVYPQARAKGITFEEHMDCFGEKTAYKGDSLRLNQILMNLSSNAVKFTPPGGTIILQVMKMASRGKRDTIRFILTDTGIGMTAEALDKIFKPFEQADASIAKNYGGTGLGMAITQNLVNLMNGSITIESQPGSGTRCTVDLPFERCEEVEEQPDFASQGLQALVIDDEKQVCEQTALLLEKIKINTEWTLSGFEGVERVKEAHRKGSDYDFCLIDWKMPDMDGVEVTRCIRSFVGPEIPIVMISAYDYTEIEEEAKQAGVNGFLPKPLYRSSVYAAIKEALTKKDGQGQNQHQHVRPGERLLEGMKLLVAEDNDLNMEIARELLQMNGALVKEAVNGSEALHQFLVSEPGSFDAILMDIQMPMMDGYEAVRQIRSSDHPDAEKIPVIATTANAFNDDITAALSAGMNAHVSKPLDVNQLCSVLQELVPRTEPLD